ncbi:MAG: acyl carrier protein [Rhodobacteraceae bacterium]|nr:acyl carrier protein [Paracoccaceae bacterium]
MHNCDAIRQSVIEIIAEQALVDPSEVTADKSLADLGLDSLGLVECIFGIEEAFDIAIPFNANTPDMSGIDISSVGSIIAEVEKLIARQAA